MGLSIESARNRIINSYHIDVEKYASDEIVDEIQKNVEDMLSFGIKSLLPAIISGGLLLSASVYFGIRHQSILWGFLFLLCVLPIWLGIWILSSIIAARSFISGMRFITNYSINVTRDIVNTINAANKDKVKFSEISFLVLYGIVLPIVKKILRNKFLSGIIYFFVEKLVSAGTRKISAEEDKKADKVTEMPGELLGSGDKLGSGKALGSGESSGTKGNGFLRINKSTSDKISQAINAVFTTLSILGMFLSGFLILTGVTISVILIISAQA